jgi:diacylglycerol kinase family enzyme
MNRLAFREMSDTLGKWRDDESVTLTKTRHVTVQSSRDVPLFLDGERVNVGKKTEISFVSDAVNVIVPKRNQTILAVR